MVSRQELWSRMQVDFHFSKQELVGLIVGMLVFGFIFSFRDWGEEGFNLAVGLTHFITAALVAGISLLFRLSCQKIYGLAEGHKPEFKIWWTGMLISLILAFVTVGRVPLVLWGGAFTSFMVRQRLGEFRYGFSYWANGMVGYWGPMGNILLALICAFLGYYFPESYFFQKGLVFNMIMALCSFIPLPQLDGMTIFLGSRGLYYTGVVLTFVALVLLLTKTAAGLVIALAIAAIYGGVYWFVRSNK